MADGQLDRRSLYHAAYAFKKTRLWKLLNEDEVFAVRLDGGRIGYCALEGINRGDFVALKLFVGAEAFATLWDKWSCPDDDDPFTVPPDLRQDCIACALEAREALTAEEEAAIRAHCRANGITFRAPHPKFMRFRPNCLPWNVTDEQELRDLHAALTAAVWLDVRGLPGVGLHHVLTEKQTRPSDRRIPLLIPDGDAMRIELIPLPPAVKKPFRRPGPVNDIALSRLKKLPKKGRIECALIRSPEPVQDDQAEAPFLPAMLLAIETEQDVLLEPVVAEQPICDPSELLNGFVDALLQRSLYPGEIVVRGEETVGLLRDFCDRAKITMTEAERMPMLDGALADLAGAYSGDAVDGEEDRTGLFNDLAALSDEDLEVLRGDFARYLLELTESGEMPLSLARRIRRLVKP